MNSDGDSSELGWQIVEAESYERSVAQCGGYERVDEIIAPIDYALSRAPLGFEKIPGYEDLYLAKTKLRVTERRIFPSHRLWFRAVPISRQVEKLWIDIAPPEDMAYTDDIFDEDF